ncbi:MAG: hypothetical protein JO072_10200 [Parafilimonas sp.]|nr:hypothetical protein [Parafilimonas sp.]
MNKSQINNPQQQQQKDPSIKTSNEVFEKDNIKEDEIESDGSANAFNETERVTEDNFDNLSEK